MASLAKKQWLSLVYLLIKAEKQDANFKYHVFHVLIRRKAMMCDQPFLVVCIHKYLLDVIMLVQMYLYVTRITHW